MMRGKDSDKGTSTARENVASEEGLLPSEESVEVSSMRVTLGLGSSFSPSPADAPKSS